MAEAILFNVVGEIIKKLSSEAFKELGMMWGVEDAINKLTNSASSIKAVLVDAENKQYQNNAIKDWLGKLNHAFYDVEDVIDEFSSEVSRRELMAKGKRAEKVRFFFSRNNQLLFAHNMAHKLKNVRENLDAIKADTGFRLTENVEPNVRHVSERGNTHSFIPEEEVVGRNDDKEEVKNHLLDMNTEHNISFIVVTGMGGLGKTTLAQFLFNDEDVTRFFDLKMWVCVSDSFHVEVVVKKIIETATKKRLDTYEMECLQSQLRELIGGKKFLLVLDDMWNENEKKWFDLKNLLMGGARGSKILITKRDEKLVREIDYMTIKYNLKGLSEEESWSLFRKVAFKKGEEPSNPTLTKLGKEIAQKCKGIPLVIRSVGCVLYYKTLEEEWMAFKDKLQLENDDVMSNLKLSYDHLPSSYLRQCFVYCSLFPKDHYIRVDELIRQSIGQGFVPSSDLSKSLEDLGYDYFMELCGRSMLQSSQDHYSGERRSNPWLDNLDLCFILRDRKAFKMHDLMHELAQMVANNECKSIISKEYDHVDKNVRHVSIHTKYVNERNLPTSLVKAKGLRTFLLQHDEGIHMIGIDTATLNKLFPRCVHLRVLKLNRADIKKLPKSIRELRQLRYLDLSENKNLKILPNSITELQNLQTLDIHYCRRLEKLPRDIKNLVNLRHLDLDGTGLEHMPKGMEKLTSLQTLNLFVLGDKDEMHACKLSELKGLNHLKGGLVIKGLKQLNNTPSEASSVKLKDKRYLRDLVLHWDCDLDWKRQDDEVDDEIVLEGLEPHPNVESLGIIRYLGGRLSNWLSSLSKLIVIQIDGCKRLQHLPQFDHLPLLKCLTLMGLDALEFIDIKDSFSSSAVFFPSLQYLHLYLMDNLKGWWKWEPCSLPCFPSLTGIVISECPKLVSMPLHSDLVSVGLCEISLKKLKFPIASSLCPTDPSSTNSFSPSALDHLRLDGIDDLEFLPNRLWQHLNNLESLQISNCQNLKSEDLQNESCSEGKLKELYLCSLPKLVSLPIGPQRSATLQYLSIDDCCNLTHLPEWIGSLVSLSMLSIKKCPNLKSLPEGMRQLQSLQILEIRNCPELQERCKTGGEDWPKIAHIPHIYSTDDPW